MRRMDFGDLEPGPTGPLGGPYKMLRTQVMQKMDQIGASTLSILTEAKEVFGVDTVELYNEALETHHPRYLDRIRAQADQVGVCLHGMAVDVAYGDLCAADEAERAFGPAQSRS